DQIQSILPIRGDGLRCSAAESEATFVEFLSGEYLRIDLPFGEVLERLCECGKIYEDDRTEDEILRFTPAELKELGEAFDAGYYFMAKDKDGKVFAYKEEPIRRGAYWNSRLNDAAGNIRLNEPYEDVQWDLPLPICLDNIAEIARRKKFDTL
ncbi:MAG: hypothetical protein Q4P84_04845, partial [Elusimicrobiales bacterium]|nr:hypothetical protein [Elusimicrobiales bacterium]